MCIREDIDTRQNLYRTFMTGASTSSKRKYDIRVRAFSNIFSSLTAVTVMRTAFYTRAALASASNH